LDKIRSNMSLKILGSFAAVISLAVFLIFSLRELPLALDGSSPEDFPNYYFAAIRWLASEAIYLDLAEDVYTALGWQYSVYPADPPATIILFSPLTLFSYHTAWILFAGSSVVLMIFCIWFVSRQIGYSHKEAAVFVAISLGSAPFLFLMKRNHMEIWLVLFAILGWSLLRNKKEITGILCWGLAASLKLFPLLWLFVTIHQYKRSFVIAGLTTIGIFALSFGLVGIENSTYYVTETLPRSRQWYGVIGNYSLISVAYALDFPLVGWIGAVLLGLSVFYAPLWRGPIDDLFIKAVSLSLILSPLSWINYQVLLIPCLIILSRYIPFNQRTPRWLFLLVALVIWGWPGEIPLNSITLTILASSMPLLATAGLFWLSHRYAGRAAG